MTAATDLLNYLSQMAKMRARCAQQFDGVYPEQLIIERGFMFDAQVKPFVNRPLGECYSNAAHYAEEHGLLYCEGYACGIIPVNHAWCVDPVSGLVHDPTWWQLEWGLGRVASYAGVLLRPRDLWAHCARTGYYSLFDGHNYAAVADLLRGKTKLPFLTQEDCPWMTP